MREKKLFIQKRIEALEFGQWVEFGDVLGIESAIGQVTGSHLHIEMHKGTAQCALPAQPSDPCNVATHIGIVNAVGIYTAQFATSAASAAVTDEEYIHRIVEKVGYDNPSFARWAFNQIKHNDRNALFRKLWETLNK